MICGDRHGPIAQRLEQQTHNLLVPGSNPGGPTKLTLVIPVVYIGAEQNRNTLIVPNAGGFERYGLISTVNFRFARDTTRIRTIPPQP
jgi:hypothetical protein